MAHGFIELDRHVVQVGFPCGSAGIESAYNVEDLGSIPELGRYPGEGTWQVRSGIYVEKQRISRRVLGVRIGGGSEFSNRLKKPTAVRATAKLHGVNWRQTWTFHTDLIHRVCMGLYFGLDYDSKSCFM